MMGLLARPHDPLTTYQIPVPELALLAESPDRTDALVSPDRQWMVVSLTPELWPLSYLGQREHYLAGSRFHPDTNSLSRQPYHSRLILVRLADQRQQPITGLPPDRPIQYVQWSPDGRYLALVVIGSTMELWIAEPEGRPPFRVGGIALNDLLGCPFRWLADSQSLLCKRVVPGRGEAPAQPTPPRGPTVWSGSGDRVSARYHPELLGGEYQEMLFEYFTATELVTVELTGKVTPIGPVAPYAKILPSPAGTHVLVEVINGHSSCHVPWWRFAVRLEVWSLIDGLCHLIATLPPADNVPIAFDAVRPGPRRVCWREDAPATLCWVEAQDGGDPHVSASVRDRMICQSAPFSDPPTVLVHLEYRFDSVLWGGPHLALVSEQWRASGERRTWAVDPSTPGVPARPLWGHRGTGRNLAPAAYSALSPFLHPDQVKAAVLLIHGMEDDSTGTAPEQSVRFYNALSAHGVALPSRPAALRGTPVPSPRIRAARPVANRDLAAAVPAAG